MKKTIKLNNRYGFKNKLIFITDNIYLIQPDLKHSCDLFRIGGELEDPEFIDLPGGPFMRKGDMLNEIKKRIDKFIYLKEICRYCIKFEYES